MKIKIELDLEDLLNEEISSYEDENGITYYRLKDDSEIVNLIKETISNEIAYKIKDQIEWGFNYSIDEEIKHIVKENKDLIINSVIDKVSKSIHNTKLIKDFKKSLD